jgi:hypothetical protein
MATMLVLGYSSENSEDVDVGDDLSSCCSAIVGRYEPSSPIVSSSSGATHGPVDDAIGSCQCVESEDVTLLEYQDCGSFFEPGTYCPRLFE